MFIFPYHAFTYFLSFRLVPYLFPYEQICVLCDVPTKAGKGHWITWNWSYRRWLSKATWTVEFQPRSSERSTRTCSFTPLVPTAWFSCSYFYLFFWTGSHYIVLQLRPAEFLQLTETSLPPKLGGDQGMLTSRPTAASFWDRFFLCTGLVSSCGDPPPSPLLPVGIPDMNYHTTFLPF